jgi:hypothetical protein
MKQQFLTVNKFGVEFFEDENGDLLIPPPGKYRLFEVKEDGSEESLVIVANQGIHAITEEILPGEVIYASTGNIGGTPMSAKGLQIDITESLEVIAKVLKGRHYQNVYIVPSGLPVLSIYIAMVVHQITAKPAIILQYDRESGGYWNIELDVRRIVADA